MKTKLIAVFIFASISLVHAIYAPGQVAPNQQPVAPMVDEVEIRLRQIASSSLGDKLAWKVSVISDEIELSTSQSKLLDQAFEQRLEKREASIALCWDSISSIDANDKKAIDERIALLSRDELAHEKLLTEKLEEILLPQQFEGLMQRLIRSDALGFAEIHACAEYLKLTRSQQIAFAKAREKMIEILSKRAEQGKSNQGVIPENEKLGEVIMKPVHGLDKVQLEKYLQARGMVENGVRLEEHYKKVGEEERSRLRKMYPVFAKIATEIDKGK